MALVEFEKNDYEMNIPKNRIIKSSGISNDKNLVLIITILTIVIILFSIFQIFNAGNAQVPDELRPHHNGKTPTKTK